MKRLICAALVAALLGTVCLCCTGCEKASEGLLYESNGDGTCTLVDIGECTDTVLRVPETAPGGERVTAVSAYAFAGNTTLTALYLPRSVQMVEESAFAGCTALQSVCFCEGLKEISGNAFSGCTALQSVTTEGMTEEVTLQTEQKNAAGQNVTVTYSPIPLVIFPKSLERLGEDAFADCALTGAVVLTANLRFVGDGAFRRCDKLSLAYLYSGIGQVGKYLFYGVEQLYIGMDGAPGALWDADFCARNLTQEHDTVENVAFRSFLQKAISAGYWSLFG